MGKVKIDEEKLAKLIAKEVFEALCVELTMVREKDDDGKPLPAPEYKKEKVFIPAWFTQNLKFLEQQLRVVNETLDRLKNNVFAQNNGLAVIQQTLADGLTAIDSASFVKHLNRNRKEIAKVVEDNAGDS